ncbi:Gamma-glutamylcysteine synthetase [Methanobrevibacter millerae]|uniref:Gamma-glutamylcysteine synthetase n=2 Tax=Methanobrevibacter millerae TaxID=230361 RepID=A0A1G5V306_9EURY|nr:Gamma-glutamylcysteine synthetase [Methanobrevibacter millerae]
MISYEKIRNRLYEEFIKPTDKEKNFIGVEIEIPIINLEKEAVDFSVVHKVTDQFRKQFGDFKAEGIDYEGNVFSMENNKTEDIVCYDCSYNNIEFAMGREKDLFSINDRFTEYYKFTKECFEEYNHTLTGMGINPYRKYNKNVPIPSERYLMLYHHLKSTDDYENVPMRFHEYPEYGMFSSASQVQLDVAKEDLVKTINVFSKIEPIKALLFSNSVLIDENDNITCFRDILWEYSTHGVNPHNIGMYNVEFEDINDLQAYLESLNIYCVMRDGAYINFPSMNLFEYFGTDSVEGEVYCGGEYKKISVKPSIDDIDYLRPFKFINLTFRGTVEFRSVCTQPIKDSMSVAAFHLGLKNRLNELDELISNDDVIYHKGYTASELRKLLIKEEIPSFIDKNDICKLSKDIVDLASEGLKDRGIGEEIFLKPLYERIKNRTNPGKEIIKLTNNNISIEEIIEDYGNI